jgi:hypothetical protein
MLCDVNSGLVFAVRGRPWFFVCDLMRQGVGEEMRNEKLFILPPSGWGVDSLLHV